MLQTVHANFANFSTPPTCAVEPTQDVQLTNKAYVDAAVASSSGSVNVVPSTTIPLDPTATVNLITGGSHTLAAGTTVGQVTEIVSTDTNAFSIPITDFIPGNYPLTNNALPRLVVPAKDGVSTAASKVMFAQP
jgi:hypothetical protein